nr:hypothetical protein [Tanacetum cinerariifolium]
VLDLEEAKTAQAKEIANLKKIVKKLEKRRKSRPAGLRRLKKAGSSKQVESSEEKDSLGAQEDASKQGRSIEDIDQDAEIALVDEAQGKMHDANMFGVNDLEVNKVIVDVREKIIEKEVSTLDPITTGGEVVTAASVEDSDAPINATTADVDDELTLAKNLITIKAAKPKATIDADRQLAKQIQAQEREQLSIEERSKLLDELLESRRKYFTAKRAKEIKIKPPTKAQQKRQELEQESAKKQKLAEREQAKVAYDDTAERKRCLEIVREDDDDVAIKATPLSSKSLTIVNYKIYKEGKKSYFKFIKADGDSQNYLTFETMFKNFNREDLEVLRSIVKERFKMTKPVDDMDNLLFKP